MGHMIDELQSLITYCEEPAPAGDPGARHIVRFHLEAPNSLYPVNGVAWFKKIQGMHPYYLEGIGDFSAVTHETEPLPASPMARFGFHVGRPNPIEAGLYFGGYNSLTSFRVDRELTCDASAEMLDVGIAIVRMDSGAEKWNLSLYPATLRIW
jgi:hypothetical protein